MSLYLEGVLIFSGRIELLYQHSDARLNKLKRLHVL